MTSRPVSSRRRSASMPVAAIAVAGRSRRSAESRSVGSREVSADSDGSEERLGRVNQRGGDGATAGTRRREAVATGLRSALRTAPWPFDEARAARRRRAGHVAASASGAAAGRRRRRGAAAGWQARR